MNRSERVTLLVVATIVLAGLLLLVVRLYRLRTEVDRLGKGVAEAQADMDEIHVQVSLNDLRVHVIVQATRAQLNPIDAGAGR